MPKRELILEPVPGQPHCVLFVTDVAHLPNGTVIAAPGTVGPLLEYGVLTSLVVDERALKVTLAASLRWTDHGPRIREALRDAIDLDGWEVRPIWPTAATHTPAHSPED